MDGRGSTADTIVSLRKRVSDVEPREEGVPGLGEALDVVLPAPTLPITAEEKDSTRIEVAVRGRGPNRGGSMQVVGQALRPSIVV